MNRGSRQISHAENFKVTYVATSTLKEVEHTPLSVDVHSDLLLKNSGEKGRKHGELRSGESWQIGPWTADQG